MRVNVKMEQSDLYTTITLQSVDEPARTWQKQYPSPLRASLEGEALGIAEIIDELEPIGIDHRRLRVMVYTAFDFTGIVTLDDVLARGFQAQPAE